MCGSDLRKDYVYSLNRLYPELLSKKYEKKVGREHKSRYHVDYPTVTKYTQA